MTRRMRHRLAAVWSAALFGCASPAVTHFYTLMPAPTADSAAGAALVVPTWELLPVTVPTQVDQPPWVVRLSDDTLAVLEQERWISPLADEVRAALAQQLRQTVPPSATPAVRPSANAAPRWRVAVEVLRFESLPGRLARLDVQWLLRAIEGSSAPELRCQASFSQPAPGGYVALAAAHRAALMQLGDAISAGLVALDKGAAPGCNPARSGY